MRRGEMFAATTSSLVQRKFIKAVENINRGADFATEIRTLEGEPCNVASMNYTESFTEQIRRVTVLQFGCPVQMNIYMYT